MPFQEGSTLVGLGIFTSLVVVKKKLQQNRPRIDEGSEVHVGVQLASPPPENTPASLYVDSAAASGVADVQGNDDII